MTMAALRVIILLALTTIVLSANLHAQNNSSYLLAREYQKNEDYLMAYKCLLIYKYTNLNLLQKPSNSAILNKLDATIQSFENWLALRLILSSATRKKVSGYTDHQLDSLYRKKLPPINIGYPKRK